VAFKNLTCRNNNKVNSRDVLRFANISTCYHDPKHVLGVNRARMTRLFLQDMYSTRLFTASREYKCLCRSLYKPYFLRYFFFFWHCLSFASVLLHTSYVIVYWSTGWMKLLYTTATGYKNGVWNSGWYTGAWVRVLSIQVTEGRLYTPFPSNKVRDVSKTDEREFSDS